jgi:hypothetical protein
MMVVDPLIERIPESAEGLEILRQDILTNDFARDIVISSDMTAAAITGTVNSNVSEYETLSKVDSVIAASQGDARILTGGLPYIRQFITSDVNHDALILILCSPDNNADSPETLARQLEKRLHPIYGGDTFNTGNNGPDTPAWMEILHHHVPCPIILISVANNYGIYLVSRHQELRGLTYP